MEREYLKRVGGYKRFPPRRGAFILTVIGVVEEELSYRLWSPLLALACVCDDVPVNFAIEQEEKAQTFHAILPTAKMPGGLSELSLQSIPITGVQNKMLSRGHAADVHSPDIWVKDGLVIGFH